jgi:hypothetical protein
MTKMAQVVKMDQEADNDSVAEALEAAEMVQEKEYQVPTR